MRKRLEDKLLGHLTTLYGEYKAAGALGKIQALALRYQGRLPHHANALWDEKDAVLIAYGDHVADPELPGIRGLQKFLEDEDLLDHFSAVHLLPFFPYSSDDGFSVIDY